MKELSDILKVATQQIDAMYFQLGIDGGDSVYRERVYCYELYHQMRKIWPNNCQYFLNGEVDKRAHPVLRNFGTEAIPDLLIHTPGAMAGNHAIIEVKNSTVGRGVRKDLKTLDLFVRGVGYKRAIYLIYGNRANSEGVARIESIANEFSEIVPIEVWLHSDAHQPATHITTL